MNTELQPRYEQVIICCPGWKTGGPEALHQLAQAIQDLGGSVSIMYFFDNTGYDIKHNKFVLLNPPELKDNIYDQYRIDVITEFDLNDTTLIIIPELYAQFALLISGIKKAIWWLSVDNSFLGQLDKVPANYAAEFFAHKDTQHFYQSEYAKTALQRHGALQRLPLSDYVNIEIDSESNAKQKQLIAYYPRKGKFLAETFKNHHSDLQFLPIENMTRQQVDQALQQAAIYIDFGHHPGKDRVPREASMAGAVVLLHEQGSAKFFEDHPLNKEYLFSSADVQNGNLYQKVKTIMSDRKCHFDRQNQYRTTIALEKQRFYLEVSNIFFEKK